MKKISLFFLIIILIVCLALPVLAAETYSYDFFVGSSFMPISNIPSLGNYRYELVIHGGTDSLTFTGISSVNSVFIEGYEYSMMPVVLVFDSDGLVVINFEFYWVYDDFENEYFLIYSPEDFDANFSLLIEKIESVGFVDSVNSGISSVISWIQSFASAFLSGELSPLLTVFVIGICVAALFFGIRSIYKFCWGC